MIKRYKAWLMAKGFHQWPRVDFVDTFSPVLKPATIWLVLSIDVNFGWPIRQFDVSNTFLNGKLKEPVSMEQPQGFVDSTWPQYVCFLRKSLYGLCQAPRALFFCLVQALQTLGFKDSKVDNSICLTKRKSDCILSSVCGWSTITGSSTHLIHSRWSHNLVDVLH